MNTQPICPGCHKPLAPNAPRGLCPECLFKAALPTGGQPDPAGAPRFTPPSPADLARHFPQFEILALIGQGGMGAVYKARQPALDRLVALKILPPETGRQPAFAERFNREARALARLSHPNIVAVHDFGQAGEFHFLAMEFVDGVNLRQVLNSGKMTPPQALAIVPAICAALQYAHDHGIVHRDIKPENILIDKTGAVKIADFGLAKLVGDQAADLSLTGAGDIMGTPHYMAPEQIERPQEVDHRADIYSLGVVFYQMLTGELPLGRFAPPSARVQVDVRLDEIVLRALEKQPQLRYQQASGLKTDVEGVATGARPEASRPEDFRSAGQEALKKIANALGLGTPPRDESSSPINAKADGKLLVIPQHNPRLPARCAKTNEPIGPGELREIKAEWVPPLIVWSILLTPIVFFILYFLFRQEVSVRVPLSDRARGAVLRQRWLAAGLAVAAFAAGAFAVMERSVPLSVLAVLLAAGATLVLVFNCTLLRLVRLHNGELWFAGAGPAFLASLPPYRAA